MNWDMKGEKCKECRKGVYKETSIYDDWDGVLHCSNCGGMTVRHHEDKKKAKKAVKEYLTFNDFLRILDEDRIDEELEDEVSKLMADISMLDATIATRTNPLMQQKQRLQKMLAVKQKQLIHQNKAKEAQPGNDEMQAQQGPRGNQAMTPGSTGASTPGQ